MKRIETWTLTRAAPAALAFLVGAGYQAPAGAIDWAQVESRDIVLFYPGQSSWEWILTQSDHSGARKLRGGKACRECHEGEQQAIGKLIVSGEKIEPNPIPGKPGTLPLNVKAAHDGERLYVRLQWTAGGGEGTGEQVDAEHQAKAEMMLNAGTVTAAKLGGCWATCHADVETMPHAAPGSELTKYLASSRTKVTREGGGESYKPAAALEQMLADGELMELWQAKLNPEQPPVAADGYVLERRHMRDAPAVTATAERSGDDWTVVLSRPLQAPGPGYFDLAPGEVYVVGFAVHDSHAAHRFHHVSFEYTLAIDSGEADFVARRQ